MTSTSNTSSASASLAGSFAPASSSARMESYREIMFREMYLTREYRLINSIKDELQGVVVAPANELGSVPDPFKWESLDRNSVWKGLIFIRSKDSYWSRGAFTFTITFPPKYPFECPVCTFDDPIPSHPLLRDGTEVQYQAEYTSLNPMQVSVLVRLLKFLRRLFAPQKKNPLFAGVDPVKAQADVQRSSVALVDRNAPYYHLLTEEILTAVLKRYQQSASGADAVEEGKEKDGQRKGRGIFESWFGSLFGDVFLPKARSLPGGLTSG